LDLFYDRTWAKNLAALLGEEAIMPAWKPLLTLPPRRYPLAFSGALALSLGLGALLGECPITTSRPQRQQSIPR
jgi:hypothetical protein